MDHWKVKHSLSCHQADELAHLLWLTLSVLTSAPGACQPVWKLHPPSYVQHGYEVILQQWAIGR